MKLLQSLAALTASLAVALAGAGAVPAAAATAEEDVDVIASRLQDYYLSQGDEVLLANGIYLARTSDATDYLASQEADGSWADVDYADRTSSANGSVWSAYTALYRLMAMAQAYRDEGADGFEEPALLAGIEQGLRYWDEADPGNTNWWETEIGESIAMGRISVFLSDVLADDALEVTLEHNTGRLDPVGANGAWRTTNYLFEAVATEDVEDIRAGFDTMVATVAVDDSGDVNEAVQPDLSFWAHGPQLYSEGYGLALFANVAIWADAARGTSLAFSRDDLDTIAAYIVGGTRWMIRGEIGMLYLGYRPPKTVEGVTGYAAEFIEPLRMMARTDPLYARDYEAVLDNVLGETPGNGLTGDRYFWRSEFASHLRPEYGIFTKLNSSRTTGGEYRSTFRPSVGNEVYWNASGATAIQVTNEEYTDLGPAFDWFHYPGVTAPYAKEQDRGPAGRLSNGGSFTGGVSDGTYGATVFTLDRAGASAQKSYFAFDDEMVALGTGITSDRDVAVHTTVNQVAAAGNASVDGEAVAAGTDTEVAGASWAYNDRVGYVFPGSQTVHVANADQTGSWLGEDPETHRAFTLYVDHGVAPEDASYEYVVLPAMPENKVRNYARKPAVDVLRNDAALQAVRHDKLDLTMATFAEAGPLDLGDGRSLEVSEPCLVILDESGRTPVVTVSNPERPGLVVDVSLSDGDEAVHGTFALGAGPDLGRSVTGALASNTDPGASPLTASRAAVDHGAALAGDGDEGTEWRSGPDGTTWLASRLEPGSYLTGLRIDWGEDHATRYLVQTSTDGTTWTDRRFVQDGDGGTSSIELDPRPASFLRVVMLESSGGAGFSVRELTPETSVNLALGRAASASGGVGGNAVDGNLATRWIAPVDDRSWLQVDLGSVQPVSTVRLRWEASFARQYEIQVSDDGGTWETAYATTGAGSDGGTDLLSLEAEGRYVRMQTVRRSDSRWGVSVWEMEVFSDDALLDALEPAPARPDLALGRPVTAQSTYSSGLAAANAVDGDPTTRWASQRQDAPYTTERWLQVDLEDVRAVSRVAVTWEAATSDDYRVQGSLDGESWVDLARVQGRSSGLRDVVDIDRTEARYVRIIGLPATKYGLSVFDLEVYGGFNLTCSDEAVHLAPVATGGVTASVSPVVADDQFTAYSLDDTVARVVGAPEVTDDGAVEVPLATGPSGATSVLLTHSAGDEIAWCDVAVDVDTSALEALVDEADALDSREWSQRTWAPLLPALEAAKSVLAADAASRDEVDAAAAALADALDGLKPVRPSGR
ncbi:polysaccharide lyase family 8 super-sandwich domain-containing protein [Pseudokineococcus marinus]|uniref:F5/8 type C domain-containing protein n=1 Tax=Pseudokineococcus marinus TaxID=351215 RepID=A0A849BQK6_9ACTN|nr:polysaccharide lyase family 8 super-sandwich domain-containing protein [Pseudokineococcus marinus]NNH21826.1 hypothetical protein [Pseudokineococcus marinus]